MTEDPMSFDALAMQSTISDTVLRPAWAGQVIAALRWAGETHGWGHLTREEKGILHCLRLRVQGRVDHPEDDGLEYAGTTGLIGWVIRILLDDPRFAARQPEYRELVAQFDRALKDMYLRHRDEGQS